MKHVDTELRSPRAGYISISQRPRSDRDDRTGTWSHVPTRWLQLWGSPLLHLKTYKDILNFRINRYCETARRYDRTSFDVHRCPLSLQSFVTLWNRHETPIAGHHTPLEALNGCFGVNEQFIWQQTSKWQNERSNSIENCGGVIMTESRALWILFLTNKIV